MSAYRTSAAYLLDVGDVILVTPALGRHRKPDAGYSAHLTVRQMNYTIGHHVSLHFTNGESVIVHPQMTVKIMI